MLVHSYIYYHLNDSIVDDHTFDRWAKELVALQQAHPEESLETIYYEDFKDFDGESGYGLRYLKPNIQTIGDRLIKGRV